MRYRLTRVLPGSVFRLTFFSLWISLGCLGVLSFLGYLLGTLDFGLVEGEYLDTLVGCLLGPPLTALLMAALAALGWWIYNLLARRLPPVELELEESADGRPTA